MSFDKLAALHTMNEWRVLMDDGDGRRWTTALHHFPISILSSSLHLLHADTFDRFWAAAPKGTKSCYKLKLNDAFDVCTVDKLRVCEE